MFSVWFYFKTIRMKSILIIKILILSTLFVQTQETSFFERSNSTNNYGMMVLGTWAISNMAIGSYGWASNSGEQKYFHQMNFFWNTINLSIAGFALYQNNKLNIASFSETELLKKHIQTENLYLINAGLDVLYVGTGFYLKHLANSNTTRKDLLRGYGNAIILQGSFLFVFDLIMYGIQHNRRMNYLENMNVSILQDGFLLQYSIQI